LKAAEEALDDHLELIEFLEEKLAQLDEEVEA
jgi:hypothetical protein